MKMPRKDAFIKWYLELGWKPTVREIRENAHKYGYEVRTVSFNGAEVAKIRWSENAQFEFIDDFIANHQAKLRSSYLDLERRLSICGVSAETKHSSNTRQDYASEVLQRQYDDLKAVIEEFCDYLAKTATVDWSIIAKYDAELSAKWESEFRRTVGESTKRN